MSNTSLSKKSFFGAAIGTLVEYYDYALFNTFIALIAPLFLPAETIYQSLIKGYFLILITAIARPFGGLVFGYLGDAVGRRNALLTSMYGIAFATFMIGFTPSYFTIGIFATIILFTAKTIQLFCFGGEFNGAAIYVIEHAQNKHEGLMGGLIAAITLVGSLLASLIGWILTLKGMPVWSWRIAFIIGGTIGIFGIFYRKNMLDPPKFIQANLQNHRFLILLKHYPKELIVGFFIGAYATIPFTTVIVFINPVLMSKGYFTNHTLMFFQVLLSFFGIFSLIAIGALSDKISPVKIIRISCLLLILFSYPLLYLVDHGNIFGIFIAEISFIFINEILLGAANTYLKNLFPMQYRYRAISFSFCLGMSVLGGLTPLVESSLYKLSGHFSIIYLWLSLISIGTLCSLHFIKKKNSVARIVNPVIWPFVSFQHKDR